MKGGVRGEKMVITIDVKDPTKIKVTNENGQAVKSVPVNTLQKSPLNGVYYVNSAAILGKTESPECIIIVIFGQLFMI